MAAVLSAPLASTGSSSTASSTSRRAAWRESFRLKLYGLVCIATALMIALQIYGVV
jgi:hypothetical protein